VPEAHRPGPAEGGEQEREDHHRGLAPEDHLAFLEAVRDRPGVEGERTRGSPDEVHEPEVPRGPGELVHEPVLGDRLHPGAHQGGELAEEPESEVAVAQPPERRGDRAVPGRSRDASNHEYGHVDVGRSGGGPRSAPRLYCGGGAPGSDMVRERGGVWSEAGIASSGTEASGRKARA